ncbi:hypothetical protein [Streptomyces sp. NPDC091278]|uniref:hypothetical protein n=1 Tax=Streptomyces sp. NPDC091278 TaxID=3155301 RepID=UPI00344ED770
MRRRKPVLVTVALCLGGALTACGGGDGEGYAAVGAGPSLRGAVTPSGAVALVPLDGPAPSEDSSGTSSPSPSPQASGSPSGTGVSTGSAPGAATDPGAGPGTRTEAGTGAPTGPGGGTLPGTGPGTSPTSAPGGPGTAPGHGTGTPPRTPSAPPPGPAPGTGAPTVPTPAPGPALLTVSAPVLADGDRRWCERVTVTFRNGGGTAALSGTVTFATHVIGALGTDWATLVSTRPLPAPIAAGTARTETYDVCVDAWRVPLGMRIDTREVTAVWR